LIQNISHRLKESFDQKGFDKKYIEILNDKQEQKKNIIIKKKRREDLLGIDFNANLTPKVKL